MALCVPSPTRWAAAVAAVMGLMLWTGWAAAQATRPSLLEQLDRETQALHARAQRSVVRVQLPPPRWLAELSEGEDHPARKWGGRLDPEVQRKLSDGGRRIGAVVLPATQPSEEGPDAAADGAADEPAGGAWRMRTSPDGREVTLESSVQQGDANLLVIRPQGRDQQGGMRLQSGPAGGFAANNIAIVVDDEGHLLVPIYLEREQLTDPVAVAGELGVTTTAEFVGSDRQTNLTVLKCAKPIGEPARLSPAGPPADGALVLLLSPTNDGARLSVWMGGANEWGVVVGSDGGFSGFARHNQFLPAGLTMPVVRELIATGRVDRPQLGMLVLEVGRDDPLRQTALGRRPGMRVQEVFPGTPAAAAGLTKGDVILKLEDAPVGDVASLAAVLCGQRGETPLTILRGDEEQRIMLKLDAGQP